MYELNRVLLQSIGPKGARCEDVLLDFRDTKTCEQKHDMLERVREKGDLRMVAMLKPYQATSGCGFLNTRDCYPCMHHDRELADAITAIQDRIKAQGVP